MTKLDYINLNKYSMKTLGRSLGKTNMILSLMYYKKWYIDLFSPKGLLIIIGKL